MNREKAKQQAEALVSQMSAEEKISQLSYDSPAIERLDIPAYNWWGECLHGVARAGTATVFPQAIGLAASFDTELIYNISSAISDEARAKFNASVMQGDRGIYKGLTFWTPNVNIFRDPRWGRGQETYGEDPFLSGRLGVAFVRGLQGDGEVMKAAACAKHFAVHSGPEALRHSFDARVSPKDAAETYLPAFKALVKEGEVEAVMGAYNRVNGEPACASHWLLQTTLREEWEFSGHVVSDFGALADFHKNHKVTHDGVHSAALAIKNGCDLNAGDTFEKFLSDAYRQGLVDEEDLTRAAVNVFTTRCMLGLFGKSEYDAIPYETVECAEHLELAERAAAESIVLLKNNGLLPLDRSKIKTLGVIGPNANSRTALIGNYHGTSSEYITVLDGIRRAAGHDVRILYSQGSDIQLDRAENLAEPGDRLSEAQTVASLSDVVVLCVGLNEFLEGEEGDAGNSYASGDKEDLRLPAPQRALMKAVASVGKPVVLCVMTGSAMDLTYADQNFDAVLQLWYPGARGGKVAGKILFGDTAPSGKLPVTFYRDTAQLPEFEDYSMNGRTYRFLENEPLYPFGFGLTYGDARVTEAELREVHSDSVTVSVKVTNESVLPVSETLQVYLRQNGSSLAPPNPELCAFKRVTLARGENKDFLISIPTENFMAADADGKWVRDADNYTLYIGTSQPDARSVLLTGTSPVTVEVRL